MQLDNPTAKWLLSDGFSVVYADIEGEMVVGGVFLRLFVANPGWVLRKPKEFVTELLEKWSEIVSVANPNVCASSFSQHTHMHTLVALFQVSVYTNRVAQCFDAVGWAAGRHPACKNLSGGVLAWLSVWSEVQTCIWPS